MPGVILSRRAEQDLTEITSYIALDNPTRAYEFEEDLLDRARQILAAPLAFRARPELGEGIRSCPLGHYVLFYTVSGRDIRIERVLHGARDLDALFHPAPESE